MSHLFIIRFLSDFSLLLRNSIEISHHDFAIAWRNHQFIHFAKKKSFWITFFFLPPFAFRNLAALKWYLEWHCRCVCDTEHLAKLARRCQKNHKCVKADAFFFLWLFSLSRMECPWYGIQWAYDGFMAGQMGYWAARLMSHIAWWDLACEKKTVIVFRFFSRGVSLICIGALPSLSWRLSVMYFLTAATNNLGLICHQSLLMFEDVSDF